VILSLLEEEYFVTFDKEYSITSVMNTKNHYSSIANYLKKSVKLFSLLSQVLIDLYKPITAVARSVFGRFNNEIVSSSPN
jgi:hypothetical protein